MEEMLANGEVDGAVTMHFPFPIGVSTVGRCSDTGKGKRNVRSKYNRNIQCRPYRRNDQKCDLRNHRCKSLWQLHNPTVGILNVDGARQTEKALKEAAGERI